jgi:hypothetical protein
MLQMPLVMLALAGPAEECDLRATVAGRLMILHQSGASDATVLAAAPATRIPDFASGLLARVLEAETSFDDEARELAAYHFAAEIHAECRIELTASY